ncbi:MAG: NfeD family protein [Bacteroidales bacterium]|nr:NfeD family protein [Bacteroidales bacterium]
MGPIILLILLGIILILAELLLIPGGIITGVLGVCSLAGASVYAFIHFGNVAGTLTVLLTVAALGVIIFYALRDKTWKKATLNTEIDAKVDTKPSEKGIEPGMPGVATTRLNPIGRARFMDKIEVEVQSEDGLIDPQCEITVSRVEDEKVFVKKLNKTE